MLNNNVKVKRVHTATVIDVSALTKRNLMVSNFKFALLAQQRLHLRSH